MRRLMLIILILVLSIICGCSWQGQKHTEFMVQAKDIILPDGMPLCFKPDAWIKVVKSEWWSMRFAWWSTGVESFTKTPYYTTGANIEMSRSDPNAITAIGEATGEAGGAILNKTVGVNK